MVAAKLLRPPPLPYAGSIPPDGRAPPAAGASPGITDEEQDVSNSDAAISSRKFQRLHK